MDSIENMRVYVKAIETGSFSAAGRELGLSRALVSKYVGQLEKSLGVRLLHRTTRSLMMTETGEAYYSRARDLIADYDELQALTRGEDFEPRGLLRVTAPRHFGARFISPVLPEFLRTYPGIHLDLLLTDRMVNLSDEGFDAAVRIGETPHTNLVARQLTNFTYLLCASPGYLKSHSSLRAPEDLVMHNCIIDRSQPEGQRWRFKGDKKPQIIDVAGRIEVNDAAVARTLVLAGAGVALCPAYMVQQDIVGGDLVTILDGWPDYDKNIYALYPYARSVSAKTRAFVNHMRKHFEGRRFF